MPKYGVYVPVREKTPYLYPTKARAQRAVLKGHDRVVRVKVVPVEHAAK